MMDGARSRDVEPEPEPDFNLFYRLDRQDRVIDMGGRGFTAAVTGEHLDSVKGRIVGTFLFDHIAGHFTRRFLREFLAGARSAGAQSRRMYRCDSPTDKIVMEMRATPQADGGLLLEHREVACEPLSLPVPVAFAKTWKAANARRCSMCNRMQARGSTQWLEPDDFARRGLSPVVIHTVCPACRIAGGARPLTDPASTRLRETI
jgi:hypothetical protein